MAKTTQTDKYANYLIASVTETAANTLTFQQMPQVTSLMEKKAFLLNRVEYNIPLATVVAAGDRLFFGLSLSDRWTDPSPLEPSMIDFRERFAIGAVVEQYSNPIISDLSDLPGGGLLIPTRPLFLFAKGLNLGAACLVVCRVFFTVLDLTPQDYWDLVEAMQAYT